MWNAILRRNVLSMLFIRIDLDKLPTSMDKFDDVVDYVLQCDIVSLLGSFCILYH